jgi:HSP20 family molecular chaperone IbpA
MNNCQITGFSVTDVFSLFDEVMGALEPVQRVSGQLLNGVFPPTNYMRDKDGNLSFEFAVAGYKEEEIDLTFKDDTMVLELNPKERTLEEGTRFIQQGIRRAPSKLKAFVPVSKFDTAKAQATLSEGLLRVSIPIREESKDLKVKIKPK